MKGICSSRNQQGEIENCLGHRRHMQFFMHVLCHASEGYIILSDLARDNLTSNNQDVMTLLLPIYLEIFMEKKNFAVKGSPLS